MIRRTYRDDGTILIESELRVEVHTMAGEIIESRLPTASELSDLAKWALASPARSSVRLVRPDKIRS